MILKFLTCKSFEGEIFPFLLNFIGPRILPVSIHLGEEEKRRVREERGRGRGGMNGEGEMNSDCGSLVASCRTPGNSPFSLGLFVK